MAASADARVDPRRERHRERQRAGTSRDSFTFFDSCADHEYFRNICAVSGAAAATRRKQVPTPEHSKQADDASPNVNEIYGFDFLDLRREPVILRAPGREERRRGPR